MDKPTVFVMAMCFFSTTDSSSVILIIKYTIDTVNRDKDWMTNSLPIFEEFWTKIHEKSRKNQNYQNSFDKVINNHMNVLDTKKQFIWYQPEELIREKSLT